ncbi:TIGR03364 family FAD-dependent oxidoreductase [Radicibacter daui]|uniref:TIGR03364 family FAD-dependent oxidoreductase n=1 Tax=Radicibacter daui TaxID=3064829 RepID=UPI004046BBC4
MSGVYDLAVVGGGILGLAHAYEAARRGKRVVLIDRDAQANGASVRNFGFITVTGQDRGTVWNRAMKSRNVWADVAPKAGIRVEQKGLLLLAQRPLAMPVLEAFMATEMGEQCALLTPEEVASRYPTLKPAAIEGALYSPHELRVESRDAIPRLAAWLAGALGVTFLRQALVKSIALPRIETTAGMVEAEQVVVCPGDDFLSLYPERIARYNLTRCQLNMLRIVPEEPGFALPLPVMSDLSLVRYEGYARLAEAAALKQQLIAEQKPFLDNGIHLIAVASADGSLVVGDSHHYATTPPPFADVGVDDLILEELKAVTGLKRWRVAERWTGTYASASDRGVLIDTPEPGVRLVIVTSGTGASTGFGIAAEVITSLFDGVPAVGEEAEGEAA